MSGTDKASTGSSGLLAPDRILAEVQQYFGSPVRRLTAPGGASRGSFRAWFDDRTIIVTQRDTAQLRTNEALILSALAPYCDDIPRILGQTDNLVFQSDAGQIRLNHAIHLAPLAHREDMAITALSGILRIQRAARKVDLRDRLPQIWLDRDALERLVLRADDLADQIGAPSMTWDRAGTMAVLSVPPLQLVKWDCRAGNAAIDRHGQLRWFDFEDAGYRHGAEDIAWLVADEVWPLAADTMTALTRDLLRPEDTPDKDAYVAYLEQFAVFLAILRLRLIINNANKRGWFPLGDVLKYDKIGVDPHMAEALAQRALGLADRHRLTAPLTPLFERAIAVFRAARGPAPLRRLDPG